VAASSGPSLPGRAAIAAFLRVYEPISAFAAGERAGWRAVAESGGASAAEMAAREHHAALRALCALPPRVVTDPDVADVGQRTPVGVVLQPPHQDGEVRVCPTDLSWRALVAVEEFQFAIPPAVLTAFMPRTVIDEAARELGRLTWSGGASGPHVRTSAWSIPLVWFAAFLPAQRLLAEAAQPGSATPESHPDADPAAATQGSAQTALPASTQAASPDADRSAPSAGSGSMSLRYLAPMADARRCIARALAAVRRNPTELMPVAEIEEFGRWLEEFHAKSVVELDYAGLVTLFDRDAIAAEDSVAEVQGGLRQLRPPPLPTAELPIAELPAGPAEGGADANLLGRVRVRWDAIGAIEHAS
jgi:hypothetical protein